MQYGYSLDNFTIYDKRDTCKHPNCQPISQCTCDVYKIPYSSPFDNSCNMLLFIHFIKFI